MALAVLSAIGGTLVMTGGALQLANARHQERPHPTAWQGMALIAVGAALTQPSGWTLLSALALAAASIRSEQQTH